MGKRLMNFLFLLPSWHGFLVSHVARDQDTVCARPMVSGLGWPRAHSSHGVSTASQFPNTEALQPVTRSPHPRLFLHCSAHVFLTGILSPPIINMSSILQVFLPSESYLTPEQCLLKIFQSLVSASSPLSSMLPPESSLGTKEAHRSCCSPA